jgi:hypothetical protein
MTTGTPTLDNAIYLRLGVPFIVLIDFKQRIRILWLTRAIRTHQMPQETRAAVRQWGLPLTWNSGRRTDISPPPSQLLGRQTPRR